MVVKRKGEVLAAGKLGKSKTVAQIVSICLILLFIILKETSLTYHWSVRLINGLEEGIYILMVVTVGITLVSGFSYLWNNRRFLYGTSS